MQVWLRYLRSNPPHKNGKCTNIEEKCSQIKTVLIKQKDQIKFGECIVYGSECFAFGFAT
jgi:hypothetical protein